MEVVFHSNRPMVESEFKRKKKLALDLIGEAAEGHAKENCPVDTGRLRNSLAHATKDKSGISFSYSDNDGNNYTSKVGKVTDDNSVYIGTNVEYGKWVEVKDAEHKTGKAHFLRDGVTQHGSEFKKIAEAVLKG